MIKFAETYFRLDLQLNHEEKVKLQNILREIASNKATERFGEVEVAVFIEDGSTKIWIPFAKRLAIILIAYGGLRDGVDHAIKDGRWLSEQMIEVVKRSGISSDRILRTERRSGTAGKIKRLLKQIDQMDSQDRLRATDHAAQLDIIREKLLEVLHQTEGEEDRSIVLGSVPPEIRRNLPEKLPSSIPGIPVALKPEELRFETLEYLPRVSTGGLVPWGGATVFSNQTPAYHVTRDGDGFKFIPD